jgi:hypothetical protein
MISRRSAAYSSMIRRASSDRVGSVAGASLPDVGFSGGGFMPRTGSGCQKGLLICIKGAVSKTAAN